MVAEDVQVVPFDRGDDVEVAVAYDHERQGVGHQEQQHHVRLAPEVITQVVKGATGAKNKRFGVCSKMAMDYVWSFGFKRKIKY